MQPWTTCITITQAGLSTVAHFCNPSTWREQSWRIAQAQEFETSLGNMVKLHLYKKI